MSNIWEKLPKPIFVLAPMDDVTDTVFRQVIADLAPPDLYFTEFVSVDGLQSKGRAKLLNKIKFTGKEKPIVAQVWGLDPNNYKKTAKQLVKMGFDGIDINMGCPERKIVKNGCCSALINNRELAGNIIKATQDGTAGRIPVSVKCRTGFNEVDTSWHEFLLSHNLDALTIHGRTTVEMSKTPNRWDVIEKIKQIRDETAPNTLVIGNGDILSKTQGEALVKKYGLDGVMLGRAVFQDPYVFAGTDIWQTMEKNKKVDLYRKHIELFADTWGKNKNPAVLKKFAKIYINGFDGASALRVKIMQQHDISGLLETLR